MLLPHGVSSQENGLDDEFALLEEELAADEIVSASKHRQSIFWSPSAVTVFTREEILASGAYGITDLLRRVPGFDIYTMKSSYTLVGARALTNRNNNLVLLLVDGREELMELTGQAFWESLSFDLEEVERIEVVRGPGSALYGANAVAAVVSVTTVGQRQEGNGHAKFTLGESLRSYAAAAYRDSADLAGGRFAWAFRLGYALQRPPSAVGDPDQTLLKAVGQLYYRLGKSLDLSLQGGVNFSDLFMWSFSGDIVLDNARTPWAMAKARVALGESTMKAQVYFNQYRTDLHFRSPIQAYGMWIADFPKLRWEANTLDGQVHLETPGLLGLDSLLLIAGANLRYSNLSGRAMALTDDDELRGAAFVHLQWEPLEMLQLVTSCRLDLADLAKPALSPRGAVVVRPWSDQAIRAGYGLAFRKPTFFELLMKMEIDDFSPSFPEIVGMAEEMGNPDLDNLILHSIEAGWQGRFLDKRLQLSVDLFYSMYKDTIGFVAEVPQRLGGLPDLSQAVISFENGTYDADAFGGEAQLSVRLSTAWTLWGNIGVRKVSYQDSESGLDESEPSLRINLGARYLPQDGLFGDLALHYVSSYEKIHLDPEDILSVNLTQSLGDRILLIARLGYRFKAGRQRSAEAGISIRTPLGAPFREYPGVAMPPGLQKESAAAFGAETLTRLLAGYLRIWF